MRSDEVIQSVRDAIQSNLPKINFIVGTIRGGWEGWLQVEGAVNLVNRLGPGSTANREEWYPPPDGGPPPNLGLRADFVLHPARGTAIYVELKVQNAMPDNILTRFRNDILKIVNLNGNTRHTHVVVAMAYMQLFDPKALRDMRSIIGGTLLVQQWDGNKWVNTTDNPINGPGNMPPTLASFKLP